MVAAIGDLSARKFDGLAISSRQKFGYPLPQIKDLLNSLPNERTPTTEDCQQFSEKFRESLDEKIEKLQKLRETLSD